MSNTQIQMWLESSLAAGQAEPALLEVQCLELAEDLEAVVVAVGRVEAMPLDRQGRLLPVLCDLLEVSLALHGPRGRLLPGRLIESARQTVCPILARIVQRAFGFSGHQNVDRSPLLCAVGLLAAYGERDGAETAIDLACRGADRHCPEWVDVLVRLPMAYLGQACERVARSMPRDYIRLALLRAADRARVEGELREHPFNSREGAEWIEQFLRDPDPVRGTFVRDVVASLAGLDPVHRKRLYEAALQHPRPDARVQAALHMARDADLAERGRQKLIELTLDVRTSTLAVHAMEGLGLDEQIPERVLSEPFVAAADVCHYLAQDTEQAAPPDAIELLDSSKRLWPPTADRRRLFLFVVTYAAGGDRPGRSFVVLAGGAAVKSFFDEAMMRWPVDDIYAYHCSWELRFLKDADAETGDLAEGRALLAGQAPQVRRHWGVAPGPEEVVAGLSTDAEEDLPPGDDPDADLFEDDLDEESFDFGLRAEPSPEPRRPQPADEADEPPQDAGIGDQWRNDSPIAPDDPDADLFNDRPWNDKR